MSLKIVLKHVLRLNQAFRYKIDQNFYEIDNFHIKEINNGLKQENNQKFC
jgi:hypothetical protein